MAEAPLTPPPPESGSNAGVAPPEDDSLRLVQRAPIEAADPDDDDTSQGASQKAQASFKNRWVKVGRDWYQTVNNNDIRQVINARQPHVFAVSAEHLDRTRELFVRPADLSAEREAALLASPNRIFLVHGPRHSGRHTVCLHLASSMQAAGADRKVLSYRHPPEGPVPFLHYAQTGDSFPEHAVFVPEAPLEAEVDATDRWDLALHDVLASRKAYLILHSEQPLQRHGDSRAAAVDARVADRRQLFSKYLAYYLRRSPWSSQWETLLPTLEGHWEEVADILPNPAQISAFCARLVELGAGATKEILRRTARTAAHAAHLQDARAWLRDLSSPQRLNEKLFALLLSLFQGLPRDVIEQIYVEAVGALRDGGLGVLRDHRETGFDDLLQACRASRREVAPTRPQSARPQPETASTVAQSTTATLAAIGTPAATGTLEVPGTPTATATATGTGTGTATDDGQSAPGLSPDFDTENDTESIFFDERICGEEMLRRVGDHLPLLRSLEDLFVDSIERYAAPGHWRIRKAFAEALGRISAWRFSELSRVADRLLQSDWLGARVMAGTVLGMAFGDDATVIAVRERKLERWIDSGEPEQMFMTGAALWRVFDTARLLGVPERAAPGDDNQAAIFRLLRHLIDKADDFSESKRTDLALWAREQTEDLHAAQLSFQYNFLQWRQDNLDSAAYALRMIARTDAAAVVDQLRSWSKEEEEEKDEEEARNLRDALGLASREVFFDEAGGLPNAQRLPPLLDLAALVLSETGVHRETIAPMMQVLARWCKVDGLRPIVGKTLLGLANGADPQAAQALRIAIAEHWLFEEHPEVQRLGTALIARSLAIEGFPCEPPAATRCLLVVDTSAAGLDHDLALVTARLEQLLGAMVDVTVLLLGSHETAGRAQGGRPLVRGALVSSGPKLLMPLLERQDHATVSCVLVLSWGAVVDLDDVLHSPWASRMLVAAGGPAGRRDPLPPQMLHFRNRVRRRELSEIELRLNVLRTRQLAAMSPQLWRPRLAAELGVDPGDHAALAQALRARIDELPELSLIDSPGKTRWILGAVLWLAVDDLEACCSLVERWLAEGSTATSSSLLAALGVASACMLLRLFACAHPWPPAATHGRLLALAEKLTAASWQGTWVALVAVRHWLEDEGWRSALTTPPCRDQLHAWLRRVAARHHEDLIQFLKGWKAPLDKQVFPAAAATPPAIVGELAERMALDIATARSKQLPELPEGGQFGIVVAGADGDSPPLQRRLAELATELLIQAHAHLGELTWLVYRCGRSSPRLVIGKPAQADSEELISHLFRDDEGQRPELLVPLLEPHDPAKVRLALLLRPQPTLDEVDLAPGPWPSLLYEYSISHAAITAHASGPPSDEERAALREDAKGILLNIARAIARRGDGGGAAAAAAC